MIVLQRRDRQILRLCYEQQFLLTEHLIGAFNQNYRECRKRIRELRTEGFLREELASVMGRKPILRLTELGRQVAMEDVCRSVPQVRLLRPTFLVHDALVTSVRLRLSEFWPDASFIPEKAIKGKEYRQVPDGIFFFPSGKGIAIEVENSDKGRSRFHKLLGRWSQVPQIILVLFVASQEKIFQTLKRYLSQAPQEQPMGLVDWATLRNGVPPVWTPKGELPILERRSFS